MREQLMWWLVLYVPGKGRSLLSVAAAGPSFLIVYFHCRQLFVDVYTLSRKWKELVDKAQAERA
ncbi:hypothetical protein PIB30_086889 [Stylosanthes scabra]|uniref:Uncharacterized protein n=1 Tax=Stylosanthes scabra TaxID=79078 RepID=A0ABU6UX03_9FABA|nr:hypothetical protein [Stylosanthes scabra]